MPATSEKQRKLFGAALAAKRGEEPISKKVADIAKHTSEKELSAMASKKEGIEGHLGQVYVVKKPYVGVELTSMIHPIDPLVGLAGSEIVPDQVHAVFPDQETAELTAQGLYETFLQEQKVLEEKKGTTVEKIKKAIDKLEQKRKEHIALAKENPGEASSHKDHIADLATKIDDLMTKMEKIEKSKKQEAKKEEKK
jgi:hypothetical protein